MIELWVANVTRFLKAEILDSDRTMLMRRLIRILSVLTCQLEPDVGWRFIKEYNPFKTHVFKVYAFFKS